MYYSVVFLLLSIVSYGTADMTPYDCPSCMQIRVGRAEYVYGPGPAPLDNPFFTIGSVDGEAMLGYSANGDTEIIVKGSLDSTIPEPAPIALPIGDKNQFDECGAWLNSAIYDGGVVRGWYHAEAACNYEIGQTYKTIAYSESDDGGFTYNKLSYPKNQILTGSKPPTPGITVGNGDHTVIEGDDGFYYLFFINWDDYGYCVARAPISSGGVPGSWIKYNKGTWSQPGLGGNATGLWNLAGSTVRQHQPSGNLFGLGNGNGVSLSVGSDPVTWTQLSDPVLYAEGSQWDRKSTSTELIAYPSFVPLTGGSEALNNTFWLYYTYLEPGAGFGDRYLVRREVTLSFVNNTNKNVPQSGVELSVYVDWPITWTTTTVPIAGNFSYFGSMGYLLTSPYESTLPLFDCYIDIWDDYMVSVSDTACINTPGITQLRHMGWLYEYEQPNTSPLFRCFNPDTLKHSVSSTKDCNGNGNLEFILGWTLNK